LPANKADCKPRVLLYVSYVAPTSDKGSLSVERVWELADGFWGECLDLKVSQAFLKRLFACC